MVTFKWVGADCLGMYKFQILKYYSRKDIQESIATIAKDREVACSRSDGSYFKRPDVLVYPRDVAEKAKAGAVAFHCSVEKWSQPMKLSTSLSQSDLNELRKGWDFVLDMDAKVKMEHAKIAAKAAADFLKEFGISPSVKFSGRRGFHVCVSQNAFPASLDFKSTAKRYPEVPQAIANFIKEKVKDRLLDALIAEEGGAAALSKTLKEKKSDFSPFNFIEFESGWGSRHLFRMPYSLNEKTWLVSVPVTRIEKFSMEFAKPDNVKVYGKFLENKENEATELAIEALNWSSKKFVDKPQAKKKIIRYKDRVGEELFPDCVKKIMGGLSEGRKRSLFTLIAFLRSVNWSDEEVEKKVNEWNKKNKPPLPDTFVRSQLKWHMRQSKKILPPNCDSELFFKSLGLSCKDCANKNPINYSFKLLRKRLR